MVLLLRDFQNYGQINEMQCGLAEPTGKKSGDFGSLVQCDTVSYEICFHQS